MSSSDSETKPEVPKTVEEDSKLEEPVPEAPTDEPKDAIGNPIHDKENTFKTLGVCPELCDAVEKLGFSHPTKIQSESFPYTLKGRDMIGLAETGSGKTAAFAIPVI